MNFLTLTVTLFLVLDPFGNIPVFHSVLAGIPEARRRRIIARELLIALAILVLFLFAGNAVLQIAGLKEPAIRISGGIILFLVALGMVFPAHAVIQSEADDDPFLVPLAVPLVAGPSALALLLLTSSKHPDERLTALGALLAAWSAAAAILMASTAIMRGLGQRGTRAMERLMGMLLVMLAVQMFLDGLASMNAP